MKGIHDPIVAEVRRHRDKLAAKFGYRLEAIAADIMERQRGDPQLVKRRQKRKRIG
jgi:hypothetical protein